ncbi:MAG: holo-ACP synthase [Bacillota bacterium]|nr:holo-ACP synthase [Bacillota bacterium]
MIKGVGVDIVEIDRIDEAIKRNESFVEKAFCDGEFNYMKGKRSMLQHAAGMFAAKEAVSKALGTGFRGFFLRDVEVRREDNGKPYVVLHNGARELAESFGDYTIHLSISHGRDNAVAYAVLEVRQA